MNWLIWKEYRQNRLIVITAMILSVVPYALAAFLIWRAWPRAGGDQRFVIVPVYSLALLQLTLALSGGTAIAGERADRSAEFLGYLPVSRGRILSGKLLATLILAAVIWVPNLCVLWLLDLLVSLYQFHWLWPTLATIAITGLTFFCVAWLCSTMLESPTFAVCVGLFVPGFASMVAMGIARYLELSPFDPQIPVMYNTICLAMTVPSFALGTVYYLRRVEP